MNNKSKFLKGPTLADVCLLAAQSGFIFQIGVAPTDRDKRPYRITVNVYKPNQQDQRAFSMDLLSTNPNMNAELGLRLMEYIEKVKAGEKRSGLVIVGKA